MIVNNKQKEIIKKDGIKSAETKLPRMHKIIPMSNDEKYNLFSKESRLSKLKNDDILFKSPLIPEYVQRIRQR